MPARIYTSQVLLSWHKACTATASLPPSTWLGFVWEKKEEEESYTEVTWCNGRDGCESSVRPVNNGDGQQAEDECRPWRNTAEPYFAAKREGCVRVGGSKESLLIEGAGTLEAAPICVVNPVADVWMRFRPSQQTKNVAQTMYKRCCNVVTCLKTSTQKKDPCDILRCFLHIASRIVYRYPVLLCKTSKAKHLNAAWPHNICRRSPDFLFLFFFYHCSLWCDIAQNQARRSLEEAFQRRRDWLPFLISYWHQSDPRCLSPDSI